MEREDVSLMEAAAEKPRRQRKPPPPEPTPLASRLKEIMKTRGLSGRGLSEASGLADDAVRNVLTGRSLAPRMSTLEALAGAMGVPVAVIVDPSLPIPAPSPTARAQPIPRGRYAPLVRQLLAERQLPQSEGPVRPPTLGEMAAAEASAQMAAPSPKEPATPAAAFPEEPSDATASDLSDVVRSLPPPRNGRPLSSGTPDASSQAPAAQAAAVPAADMFAVPELLLLPDDAPVTRRTWSLPRDVFSAQDIRPEQMAIVRSPMAVPDDGIRRGDILIIDIGRHSGSPPGLHIYTDGLATLLGHLHGARDADEVIVRTKGGQIIARGNITGRVIGRLTWL